jgi:hypothetical protein
LKLLDASPPLTGKCLAGGRAIGSAYRIHDFLVRQCGEGEVSRFPEIGRQIAPGDPAKIQDELQQAAIGTCLQQDTMPLVLEIDAAARVSPCLLETFGDLSQPIEPLGRKFRSQIEGQKLESGDDLSRLPDLRRVERRNPKAAPHVCIKDALTGHPKEGFADGSAADTQLAGQVGIADSGAGGRVAPVDPIEEPAIDLVAERTSGD